MWWWWWRWRETIETWWWWWWWYIVSLFTKLKNVVECSWRVDVFVDRKICNKMRRRRETKENQKNEEGRGK